MPPKNNRIIMYVDYPTKMKIGLYMQQNGISGYSNFLRLATFFFINNLNFSNKVYDDSTWNDWKQEKNHLKTMGVESYRINDYRAVIEEIKEVIKKID